MVCIRSVWKASWVAVCLATASTVSCRGGAERVGGASKAQVAVLTTTGGASTAAVLGDQAKADAFAQQARAFAELAARERAQAASVAATISARPQVTAAATAAATANPAASKSIASAAATSAEATSGSPVAGGAPGITAGVPAAAATYEAHLQKVAALADRLGANAQRLASFHLARVNQPAGAVGKGGAQ